jgi:undecaprenyl-diphosphatase
MTAGSIDRSRTLPPAWMLVAAVIAWVLGLTLSALAAGDGMLDGDVRVARWVQWLDGTVPEALADFGNWIGTYSTGVVIAIVIALWLGRLRRSQDVLLLGLVMGIRALNTTVKAWIDSPRPTPGLVRVTERADGLGFPSGHSSGAMILFGALAWISWQNLPPGQIRSAAIAGSILIVFVVGAARIYTGAHWPSDVLGGYVLAIAMLLTLIYLIGRYLRSGSRLWTF